jgi:SAM-dependent methyltransferase
MARGSRPEDSRAYPSYNRASVGYQAWHEAPPYWGDVTRHFDAGARVLDVGCGTGWLADHLGDYTGVDRDPRAVEAGTRRGRNLVHVDLDRSPLPFPEASFDGAILKDVLEHVLEPAGLVAETHRVLRDGGRAFASAPDVQRWVWDDYTHVRPFSLKAFRRLFGDHDFAVEAAGYESVMPGIELATRLSGRNRRPRLLNALARLSVVPRNVWIVARKLPASAADGEQ